MSNDNAERVLVSVDENEGLDNQYYNNINPTVSIHQLCEGEVIIQICINPRNSNNNKLSNLIQKAEEEGLRIIGTSTVSASHHDHQILTSHLHVQMMDRSLQEAADNKSISRKRVISWLCC
ncbi:hypothetical protein IC582_010095 [Cucumis melo]